MHTVTHTNEVRQVPQMSNGRDGLEGARGPVGREEEDTVE